MRNPLRALLVALLLGAGLAGCSPQGIGPQNQDTATSGAPISPLPASRACEGVAMMLTIDSASPRAGETVSVSTDPAECSIDEQWAGEVIVRTSDGDTRTGSRLEIGATAVSVDLPPGLTGPALVMLAPDQDCEQTGAPGDCHYPYVEIQIGP